MKKLFLIATLFLSSLSIYAQRSADLGLTGGSLFYLGDVNHSVVPTAFNPGFGLLYRINFNRHYAMRVNFINGKISGNDQNANNGYQQERDYSFEQSVGEISAQIEFSFLPFNPDDKKKHATPYIFGGAGMALILKSEEFPIQPVIPFGLGYKINVSKKLNIGLELGFRKTFTDGLDKLTDNQLVVQDVLLDNKQKNQLFNKDWYYFTAIYINFTNSRAKNICPAYQYTYK